MPVTDIKTIKWYQNGLLIKTGDPNIDPGANSILLSSMGNYKVITEIVGCGTMEENVKVTLSDSNATSRVFEFGYIFNASTILGKTGPIGMPDYLFGGDIIIPKQVLVSLNGLSMTNPIIILCKPCTRIIIEAGDTLGKDGGFLDCENVIFMGMDEWNGIQINGLPYMPRPASMTAPRPHGFLYSVDGLIIKDAQVGIYSDNGGMLKFEIGPSFYNCHNALVLKNYSYPYQFYPYFFKFFGSYTEQPQLICENPMRYTSLNDTSYRKQVYLENVNDIRILDAEFHGSLFSNGNSSLSLNRAVECVNASNLRFDSVFFDGAYDRAFEFINTSYSVVDSFRMEGWYNTVFNISQSDHLKIGENVPIAIPAYYNVVDASILKCAYIENSTAITFRRCQFINTTSTPTYIIKGISLTGCDNSTIEECRIQSNFDDAIQLSYCLNIKVKNSEIENTLSGIDMFHANYCNIENCNLINLSKGINSNQSSDSKISGNSFENVQLGILSNDCDNLLLTNNNFDNTTGAFQFNKGGEFHQGNNNTFNANTFTNCSYGLQYYNNHASSGSINTITQNYFIGNDYGLTISPDATPVNAPLNNNNTGNLIPVIFSCNLFRQNNFAIVGSGNIPDQGDVLLSNGNKFDSNVDRDLVWQDYDANWFIYYSQKGSQSEPLIPNPITTIILNGIMFPGTYKSNYTDSTKSYFPLPTCFGKLNKTNGIQPYQEPETLNHVLLNPIENVLWIASNNKLEPPFECYNLLGQQFSLDFISTENKTYRFDASNLTPGLYFFVEENKTYKFIKK